jgi:hypothetical protein
MRDAFWFAISPPECIRVDAEVSEHARRVTAVLAAVEEGDKMMAAQGAL